MKSFLVRRCPRNQSGAGCSTYPTGADNPWDFLRFFDNFLWSFDDFWWLSDDFLRFFMIFCDFLAAFWWFFMSFCNFSMGFWGFGYLRQLHKAISQMKSFLVRRWPRQATPPKWGRLQHIHTTLIQKKDKSLSSQQNIGQK